MHLPQIQQYRVERTLGAGAHGVAYFAYDTRLLRPVVIKMLLSEIAADPHARITLLKEARLASQIDHPNVCSIYEIDEHEGATFVAMQYVPGHPLETMLKAGPMSPALTVSTGVQVADGLYAAHQHGIVHRDLKPGNIMVTEGGLVKILDFGLAVQRHQPGEDPVADSSAAGAAGTLGYIAPELFVGEPASEQSDVFSLGVVLFRMVAGAHPFWHPNAGESIAHAIQFRPPRPLRALQSQVPAELEAVIMKALQKHPADRYSSAATLRDALKTVASLSLDSVTRTVAPGIAPERKRGLWSALAELVVGGSEPTETTVAVLPFKNAGGNEVPAHYGFALADAIATRLARLRGLAVRPSTSLLAMTTVPSDAVEAGRSLHATHVVDGTFIRNEDRFLLTWQLLAVKDNKLCTGDTITAETFDLTTIQDQVCEAVFASLHGTESLRSSSETPTATLDESDSETYLQARALLSAYILRSRHAADLEHAKAELKQVLSRAPSFAPAHAALGIARLQFVRNGLADVETLKAAAAAFERALELDPHLVEAKLFRVYTLLALGEKESARHAVHHLLEVEPDSFDVHLVAAMLLRLDGMFEAALSHLAIALRLNPNNAPIIYNARARILHYRGQVDAAVQETQKGLELDPKNPMLRTTLGYLQLRLQDNHSALATLQSVLADEPSLQVARVTLAQCYLALARVRDAEAQLSDSLMAAAHCDPEIAYRIASYHAKRCDTINALTWLRRAIYVGNENFPWFRVNPAWDRVAEHPDFQAILDSLELRYRRNAKLWRQLLGHDFH